MMIWAVVLITLLTGTGVIVILHYGLWSLIVRQSGAKRATVQWEDLGPTPLGEKHYTPQGMTFARGKIVFANSWQNTRSRVYEIDPDDVSIGRTFDMPGEAVHTSGLGFDGQHLWAVDYVSNRCYKIDMEKSFETGQAVVTGSFATGLGGTSACCFLDYNGRRYLAISDFMRTRRTYIIRHEDALRQGRMTEDTVVFSYENEGFCQGLEWNGRYLFESEGKLGVDVVNQMDLSLLVQYGNARQATVRQMNAPSKGVEDLAWDGRYMYTSDETTFRFYRTRLHHKD